MNDNSIVKNILKLKNIAVVGMSPKKERPSNFVSVYMANNGYNIIPVNPGQKSIEGQKCYPSLLDIPTKIDIRCPKKIFFGWAVSSSGSTKTIKTVAPKENINQIPEDVFKVKKASKVMTIAAEIPEIIGSKFFAIFIYVFPVFKLYTFYEVKKI